MMQLTINDELKLDVDVNEHSLFVNNKKQPFEVQKLGAYTYHLIQSEKSYFIQIIKIDTPTKTVRLKVNGRLYEVKGKDKTDLLLEKMGFSSAHAGALNNVNAPMPGQIVKVDIKVGDEVKKGQTLLVLNAMKMENIIKSPGDGKVKKVLVKAGDNVEKNQPMIEF